MGRRILQAQEWGEAGEDFRKNLLRHAAGRFGSAFLPVKTLDVVGQHNACDRQAGRQRDFERITFDLARHGTDEGEAGLGIVGRGR